MLGWASLDDDFLFYGIIGLGLFLSGEIFVLKIVLYSVSKILSTYMDHKRSNSLVTKFFLHMGELGFGVCWSGCFTKIW